MYCNYDNDGCEEAIDSLKEYLKLKPDDISAHRGLAMSYFRKGKKNDAIKELIVAAHIKPDDAVTHFNLGFLYEGQDMDKAIYHYKKAVAYDPKGENGDTGRDAKKNLDIIVMMKKYNFKMKSEAKIYAYGGKCKTAMDKFDVSKKQAEHSTVYDTANANFYMQMAATQGQLAAYECSDFYSTVKDFMSEHTLKGESLLAGYYRLQSFAAKYGFSSIISQVQSVP